MEEFVSHPESYDQNQGIEKLVSFLDESGEKRFRVTSERDLTPFASGRGTMLFLNWEDDSLKVLLGLDVTSMKWEGKYPSPRFVIPGGLRKLYKEDGKKKTEEYEITARQEGYEEVGVFGLDEAAIFPLCSVVRERARLRDTDLDVDAGKHGTIEHYIFAHFGFVEPHKTDDKDVRDFRWFDVRRAFNEDVDEIYPDHIALLGISLAMACEMFHAYISEEIYNPEKIPLPFFERMSRTKEATASLEGTYAVQGYREKLLDILSAIDTEHSLRTMHENVGKPAQWGSNLWRKFQWFPLGLSYSAYIKDVD